MLILSESSADLLPAVPETAGRQTVNAARREAVKCIMCRNVPGWCSMPRTSRYSLIVWEFVLLAGFTGPVLSGAEGIKKIDKKNLLFLLSCLKIPPKLG